MIINLTIEKRLWLRPMSSIPNLGNGLYEIGPGCISGRRGLELLDEEIRKTVQDPNFKLRGVPVVDTDKVVLPNGRNITFNNKEDE